MTSPAFDSLRLVFSYDCVDSLLWFSGREKIRFRFAPTPVRSGLLGQSNELVGG